MEILTSELSNDADHFLNYVDLRFDNSEIKGREATISGGSPIQLLTNEKKRGKFKKKYLITLRLSGVTILHTRSRQQKLAIDGMLGSVQVYFFLGLTGLKIDDTFCPSPAPPPPPPAAESSQFARIGEESYFIILE